MKRLFWITVLGACVSATASAQEITYGPEAGVNLSNVSGDMPNTDMKLGIKAGAVVNIPAGGGFYLQPGLFFSQKGYQSAILGIDTRFNLNYVELPVNILYMFDLGNAGAIFASAGMYAALAVNGTIKIEDVSKDIDFGSDGDEKKRFDYGANFGIGYETRWGIYLRGQYGLGLANVTADDDFSMKNNGIQITLGYLFGNR